MLSYYDSSYSGNGVERDDVNKCDDSSSCLDKNSKCENGDGALKYPCLVTNECVHDVYTMLMVFASITNVSSLTAAMTTQDVQTPMTLTSAFMSPALSKMTVPPWMELLTLNVITRINVCPTMNAQRMQIVKILKEVTHVLVMMVATVTVTNVTMIINVNSAIIIAISMHGAPILTARLHAAVIQVSTVMVSLMMMLMNVKISM